MVTNRRIQKTIGQISRKASHCLRTAKIEVPQGKLMELIMVASIEMSFVSSRLIGCAGILWVCIK